MLEHHVSEILLALTVASCGLAFWKGGAPERFGAALIALDWLVIYVAQAVYDPDRQLTLKTVAAPALAADLLMCFGFLWLVLRYGSLWLGSALLIQGAQLAVYGSYLAGEGTKTYLHTVLINVCSFLLLDALLIGVGVAWWRRVRDRRRAADASA